MTAPVWTLAHGGAAAIVDPSQEQTTAMSNTFCNRIQRQRERERGGGGGGRGQRLDCLNFFLNCEDISTKADSHICRRYSTTRERGGRERKRERERERERERQRETETDTETETETERDRERQREKKNEGKKEK